MSILIVGSEGSMGKRYKAILKYLATSFTCADLIHDKKWIDSAAARSDGIIIATPTDTHLDFIRQFSQMGKPILCEKPMVKSRKELSEIVSIVKENKTKLRMTYQYQMLDHMDSKGSTSYNYFRHGNDGLVWDCMQVISLARSNIALDETSPIWECKLNGDQLNLSDMDKAYVDYIKLWFNHPEQDLYYLSDIHSKVIDFEKHHGKH